MFQTRSRASLEKIYPDDISDVEHILWTSSFTEKDHIDKVPKDYTIQIWTYATVSQLNYESVMAHRSTVCENDKKKSSHR